MRALNALLPPEATASATSTRHTLAGPQRARAPLLWFAVSVTLAALFSYFSWIPMFISIVGIQPDPGALSGPIIRVETIQGIVVSEGAGTQTGSAIEFFLFPAGSALSMAPLDHLSGSVSLQGDILPYRLWYTKRLWQAELSCGAAASHHPTVPRAPTGRWALGRKSADLGSTAA